MPQPSSNRDSAKQSKATLAGHPIHPMLIVVPLELSIICALVLSFAGSVLGAVTGWLGGELVDRLAVGVVSGAHLNAPSAPSG